jgi:nickel-dependent lactate racemase
MKELRFQYGSTTLAVPLPGEVEADTLETKTWPGLPDPSGAIREALRNPIGSEPLPKIVRAGERVAILVNDITRLVRSDIFLPVLLNELNAAGIPDRDIFVVFALGIHRRQSVEEQRRIVGDEVARRVALYDHDCHDRKNLVRIGQTARGNEVWINRRVHEADRVILTGEIIYHLIAGYSGGRKSVVPGVAGAETTTFNHKFILHPQCRSGILDGNPAHEDLLEACRLLEPDFLLNVILNPAGQLVHVLAGHFELAHRAGCALVDQMYRVPISRLYDLVLAGAGGLPFDLDLRQAHKGMENASRALAPDGAMVYFAECRDGLGSRKFEEWVDTYASSAEMVSELRRNFVVGGHKAYWVVRLGERWRISLASSLEERFVRQCHLHPVSDAAMTIRDEIARLGPGGRIAYIPHAGFVLPTLEVAAAKEAEKILQV